MQYVSRADWGAKPAKSKVKMSSAPHGWFWHWLGVGYPDSMSDAEIMRAVQRYHQESQGWADFAYHWAVGRDGKIYEGRGWGIQGGATRGYNTGSYALVFLIGEGELPTPQMFAAAERVYDAGPQGARVRPHNAVRPTSCPGDEITEYIQNRRAHGGPPAMTEDEAKSKVTYLYQNILGREPDDAGLEYWAGRLVGGSDIKDVRWAFLEVRLASDRKELSEVQAKLAADLDYPDLFQFGEQIKTEFYAELAALLAAQA